MHKSLFQQTDMVEKQIHYMLGWRSSKLRDFCYIMHIRNIKTINYFCKFVLDKSFVM